MGIFPSKQKNTWYFPGGPDLQLESGSNAALEMFRDNPLDSLTREICQNSLDAKLDENKPVRVTFKILRKETKSIKGIDELRKDIIKKAKKQWPNEDNTQRMLKRMEKVLNQEYLDILKISDYNTIGLPKSNWESLINQVGSSVKKDSASAGLFGIGKGAPFAVSDLRMVFYNTVVEGRNRSIGVMKFVSFKEGDKITQGTGYSGKNGSKKPVEKNVTFDDDVRKEGGTDIYVMGINKNTFEDWENQIKYSLVDNFLYSFYKKKLVVDVNNFKVDFSTIDEIIAEISSNKKLSKKYASVLSYYGVLKDEERDVFPMIGLEKYGIQPGEATLITSKNVESNRCVLMTRSAGMKIYEQKNISGTLKFSGIFHAEGKNINNFLKKVENPSHDKWSADRYSDDPKFAKNLIKDLRKFIRESINQKYKEKIEDEVDAFGVSEFLPDDINDLKGKEGLSKQKDDIKIELVHKEATSSKSIRDYETSFDDDMSDDLERTGRKPGEHGGAESYGTGNGKGLGTGDNRNGVGGSMGNFDKTSGDQYLNKGRRNRSRITRIKYRCIEVDAAHGIHDLLLWSDHDLSNVKVDVDIIGDSGNKGYVSVLSAQVSNANFETQGHSIYLPQILKKRWQKIRIKLNRNTRLKLEVEVYAYTK
ncbi:hypothetical protein FAX13_09215 [Ligilactobacillus animalis]|nr:hypothetical protein FAX13_09215 [Ligilactobacillus animalis]